MVEHSVQAEPRKFRGGVLLYLTVKNIGRP